MEKRRNCEAVGQTWGRKSEAAGQAGLGFASISDFVINLLPPERDNESLKHYFKLMIALALFLERVSLVNY